MDRPTVTAYDLLTRSIEGEQRLFMLLAQEFSRAAARIAETTPAADRIVSGDIGRLIQNAAELMRRASKIEASAEALSLIEAERETQ